MKDEKRNAQQRIINEVLEKLAEEARERGEPFDPQKVPIAELVRRTNLSRMEVRTLKKKGFDATHGNCGRKKAKTVLTGFTEAIDDLLRKGVTNCSKILEAIRKLGYEGGRTSVQDYVKKHGDLVPAKRSAPERRQVGNRGRRFKTEPGEAFQMDWGFVNLVDILGLTWKLACFVMVCHHCGAAYVEFFTNARQENLFIGIIHAFMALGIPDHVLTDNMKSVVTERDADGRPVWNVEYEAFMKCLGFKTRLCKVRHPFTKGKV